MSSSPSTRASLLLSIRDPKDRVAWGQFVQIYAPLIHGYGRHHGLQDSDAADLTQEVLRCLVHSAPDFQYDPTRGSFRGWLFAVTRNALRKLEARTAREAGGSGDTEVRQLLEQQPDPATDEERWCQEYRWNLFQWASEKVRAEFRERTWQAFWRTAVLGEDIDRVAADLCVSPGAVYIARSRVTARIRREIQAIDGE
jgi:RNA polymerase sigma-70 factor (ECF subfamily)